MNHDLSVDPVFESVKNKEELTGWLMRAYFNPTKHGDQRYFKATVTRENVLEFVSEASNNFPQTPYNIVGMWNLMPSLREGLRGVPDGATDDGKEDVYTKGEQTLAVIGKAIGGVTPTMVNKISEQATVKFSAMLRALNGDNKWLVKEAEEKIENAFLSVAEVFADGIQKSKISGEVLEHVADANILSLSDAFTADDIELDAIQELIDFAQDGATQSELEDIILEDLGKSINVFQTAQLAVARMVFPAAKRGRPRKDKSSESEYADSDAA